MLARRLRMRMTWTGRSFSFPCCAVVSCPRVPLDTAMTESPLKLGVYSNALGPPLREAPRVRGPGAERSPVRPRYAKPHQAALGDLRIIRVGRLSRSRGERTRLSGKGELLRDRF